MYQCSIGSLSFRNKVLLSYLLVIVLLSAGFVGATRWILRPGLVSELNMRGLGIAFSIADRGKAFVLSHDKVSASVMICVRTASL